MAIAHRASPAPLPRPRPATGAPLTVAFSAATTDADGDALTYSWSFVTAALRRRRTRRTVSYQRLGFCNATLTVSDGKDGTATQTIQVNALSPERDPNARLRILVFSETAAFRHSSIDEGVPPIRKLGAAHNFQVDASEESSLLTDGTSRSMTPWSSCRRPATSSTRPSRRRSSATSRPAAVTSASMRLPTPSTRGVVRRARRRLLPRPSRPADRFDRHRGRRQSLYPRPARALDPFDEWYDFKPINFEQTGNLGYSPRGQVHVLPTLDESTYTGEATGTTDPPISLCQRFDGGRSWYTALGHTETSYLESEFARHILGGIEVAAGAATSRACAARAGTAPTPRTKTATSPTTATAKATTHAADPDLRRTRPAQPVAG